MSTLSALHRAVIEAPADRTVRLVSADALEETGEPADVARAEFIRSQIELQSVPEPQRRHYELAIRCRELFDEHWLAGWRPVAQAAGLPAPRVPGRRPSKRRPVNWPYTHTSAHGHIGVHLIDYGMSVRFEAGFPEEVRLTNREAPQRAPELVHRWGDA